MKIEIEYDGSTAKCKFTSYYDPKKWTDFSSANHMSKVMAIQAMRTIVKYWDNGKP